VVAATNRDLDSEVAEGHFRQDLLFRLNTHVVKVPPLRERLSDVPLLANHFLQMTCEKFGCRPRVLAPETLDRLKAYHWSRNNIRELRNVIERLVIATSEELITPNLVPAEISAQAPVAGDETPLDPRGTLKEQKSTAERQILLAALERNDWHITHTAQKLGLADHSSLLKIMKRHGLKK